MNSEKKSLQEQLKKYKYSIDDFYIRLVIYLYDELREEMKRKYKNNWQKQQAETKKAIQYKQVKITRQFVYNLLHHNNDVSQGKAKIVLRVLNEIRSENGDRPLIMDELDMTIYRRGN